MVTIDGRNRGFTLFELIVVLVIVSLMSAFLARRLGDYQELAEKVTMEQTVQAARSGLQLKIAALLLRGPASELAALSGSNPVVFLADPPGAYLGEYADSRNVGEFQPGSWYFDTERRELVYLIARDRHFRPGRDGQRWARFRTVVDYRPDATAGPGSRMALGLATIEKVNDYIWDLPLR